MGLIERVRITAAASVLMREESQVKHPLESGGVLVGRLEGTAACIGLAVGPGPGARHGRSSFLRDGEYAQRKIDAAFEQSDGLFNYLGEWHSHSECQGPSGTDTSSMLRISRNIAYQTPEPLLMICMRKRRRWMLKAYCIREDGLAEIAVGEGDCNSEPVEKPHT